MKWSNLNKSSQMKEVITDIPTDSLRLRVASILSKAHQYAKEQQNLDETSFDYSRHAANTSRANNEEIKLPEFGRRH